MNKPTLHTIDNDTPKSKTPWPMLVIGLACLGVVLWAADHIAGGCLDFGSVFKYCELSIH